MLSENKLVIPRTDTELIDWRDEMIHVYNKEYPGINLTNESFTCHKCSLAHECIYAYDIYNTGGDCLADK